MMRYAGANSILQATDWVQSFTEITLIAVQLNPGISIVVVTVPVSLLY